VPLPQRATIIYGETGGQKWTSKEKYFARRALAHGAMSWTCRSQSIKIHSSMFIDHK
jgi:hypothetical protein